METAYFPYGGTEIEFLRAKDRRLAAVIDRVGHVDRACRSGLFESVVHSIVGQQISTKAHASIWGRIEAELGPVAPETLRAAGRERLQSCGITWRKADYILEFAEKVQTGAFPLDQVASMSDGEAIAALSSLRGVGVWTAEMILLFCLQRPNIFSYGDLAILRGIRMVYRHRELDRARFERYRKRFSPYCSVASLYFWAVAGGALPELTDPAAKNR